MDWHVEVIRFECICHFTKSTESIIPGRLLKAECFLWLTAFLSQTLRTPPVSLGNVMERRDQAEGVVAVITPIAQEKPVLVAATATQEADVQVNSIGSFFSSTLGFFLLTFCNTLFLFNRFLLDAAFHVFVCKRQSRLALSLLCLLQLSPSSPPPPEAHTEWVSCSSHRSSRGTLSDHAQGLCAHHFMMKCKLSHHSDSKI